MFKTKKSRFLAILLAAALAVAALTAGLGSTLAAKPDVVESFTQPNSYPTIEKGASIVRPATGGRDASSANSAIAAAAISGGNVTITGVKAGSMTVVVGSSAGWLLNWPYQITDSGNPAGYKIKNGGEVYINGPTAAGKSIASPVTAVPAGAFGAIAWHSLQEDIATVSANGAITSKPNVKGAAVIVGEFTDKWGVNRDLHILVGVGVSLGGSSDPNHPGLGDLLEWIRRGEAILGLEPNPYTDDSLRALEDAVNGGKGVLDSQDPAEQQIKDAVGGIKKALEGLVPKNGGGLAGPIDGNYYKPVGDPDNVYELVDKDGNSKHQPPKFIYDRDGSLKEKPPRLSGDEAPAVKGDDNSSYVFRVEDPAGSNIWKRVKGDGALSEDDVIWGGPDGKPGGGDDRPLKKFGGDWWVSLGQNVWRKVNGPQSLGPLTGGGPNRNPATGPVAKIFDNTAKDGRYYAGPLGPDETGYEYYYGDPKAGGDGYLDSTASSPHGDDVKYYRDADDNMVTQPPIPSVGSGNPGAADPGRVLTPDKTGDSADWIEIARSGGYSLIVRKSYINIYTGSGHYGDPAWQYTAFGSSSAYGGSAVRTGINNWFKTNVTAANGDNLPANARLRGYTVQNDAADKLGMGSTQAGMANAFSKPTTYQVGDGNDVAFALSYTEAANFCSKTHDVRGANPEMQPSANAAKANWSKLSLPQVYEYGMWLRTPGDLSQTAGALDYTGRAFQFRLDPSGNSERGLVYPALWVNAAIFN